MNETLFDIVGLLKRTMEDRDIAKEILECYLEESPLLIKDITNAATSNDLIKVREKSHELKGSSASVGALQIESLASKIQYVSENDDLENVKVLIDQLAPSFNETQTIIINSGYVN